MIISSIDTETCGTTPGVNQMIQLAVVLDDLANQKPLEDLPRFKCYIAHESYNINASLIALNDEFHTLDIVQKIAKIQKTKEFKLNGSAIDENGDLYLSPEEVGGALFSFYKQYEYPTIDSRGRIIITPAGKNVSSFDVPMIKSTLPDHELLFSFSHRSLDPAILFWNPFLDNELPSLSVCKERAVLKREVAHDALEDCLDIVKLLRFHFNKKP